jgi:hypothetical protein
MPKCYVNVQVCPFGSANGQPVRLGSSYSFVIDLVVCLWPGRLSKP